MVFTASIAFLSGCEPKKKMEPEPHHVGGKVNTSDFLRNPSLYRSKSITLSLYVEEKIDKSRSETLQNFVGRDVKFVALTPKGERLEILIRLPEGLKVPAVGNGDLVYLTFVCHRGRLREGNEARKIDTP